ncbi:right-handed parallel beta-helix repeat-containing protein [Hymenobacter terrenus]|uniref:right-handed parallel beta-helix repeat-containing protein n=1 Tax=Hymenobacter terrenus TaxID=1629124 RepID=UPI00061933B8|nr:right-handed parallel beta-helix repeat-containing protein [Hymenobacter terrenus]
MKPTPFITFLLLLTQTAFAETWYVTGTGNDANNGKTLKTAFRSLQKAANLVNPGDVVLVGKGIYTNDNTGDGGAVVSVERSGKPNAWITWKALPGQRPEIHPIGWTGIQIRASYQVFEGLTVLGNNDSIKLEDAIADSKIAKANPYFNTNGICFDGRKAKPDAKPHHVVIRKCVVGKCAGGGITGLQIDYLTVEDCQVFNNAWFMRYAGSGITLLDNWAFDDAPGYHVVIQRNLVWNNKTQVPWDRTGKLSDGNGILLDVTDQPTATPGATNPNGDPVVTPGATNPNGDPIVTPPAAPKPEELKRPEWKGRALIANNVSAYNGGSGIHTFRTKHVDIINNTTYWNGQVVGYEELFANRSEDVVILNNIMVPKPGGKVTSNNRNTNVRWDYNLYPEAQQVVTGPHDLVADPQFVAAQTDLSKGNFRLAKGSKARDSGCDEIPQPTDIVGKTRPQQGARDRGAFEQ